MSKPYKLSGLVRMATSINTLCTSQPTSDAFKAVLYIELQAVTQVIAQQLALHLDPSEPEKLGEVVNIINELNRLMDDKITGGGPEGGHGMVVALHLFKLLKSSRKFTDLFKKKYDSVLKGINCLEPFYWLLQVCNTCIFTRQVVFAILTCSPMVCFLYFVTTTGSLRVMCSLLAVHDARCRWRDDKPVQSGSQDHGVH